jgi:pimeloyl-ACP methyl ester carboxylesterase
MRNAKCRIEGFGIPLFAFRIDQSSLPSSPCIGSRYDHRMIVRALLLTLAAAAVACTHSSTQAFPLPRIELTDCSAQYFGSARCGTYEVWEDRAAKSGRRIPLHIVVLPARGAERHPDPLFYFAGGPGSAATETAAMMARLLGQVNQTRDLVFVDVRGTGRSGALRCELPDGAPLQRYFDDFLSDDFVRACLQRQSADVRFYTQPFAMDDIDDVRQALGYDRINLFGSSGGTRQEQIYMRRHGTSVRTAVLFGVQPMDAEMPLSFSRALDEGAQWLVRWCARTSDCHSAYPDLAGDWERSKQRFASGPVEVTLTHPRTGQEERVRISRGGYADGVRHMLYNLVAARRDLPARIHAAADGDFVPFAQGELRQAMNFDRALADGFYISSTCAEDVRFITEDDIRVATEGTFLGDYRVRRQQAACRIWPPGQGIDPDFQRLVNVNVPVLVMSGEVDVATPVADGERAARALPAARHIILPNQGHGYENAGCWSAIVASFIATSSHKELDLSCVEALRREGS